MAVIYVLRLPKLMGKVMTVFMVKCSFSITELRLKLT